MSHALRRVRQEMLVSSSFPERNVPVLYRLLGGYGSCISLYLSFRYYHHSGSGTATDIAVDSKGNSTFCEEYAKSAQGGKPKQVGDDEVKVGEEPFFSFHDTRSTPRSRETLSSPPVFLMEQRSLHAPLKFRARSSSFFSQLAPFPSRSDGSGHHHSQPGQATNKVEVMEVSRTAEHSSVSSCSIDGEAKHETRINPNDTSLGSSSYSLGTSLEEVKRETIPSSGENYSFSLYAKNRIQDVSAPTDTTEMNEVEVFLEHVELQTEASRFERNQQIPYPDHPETLIPAFRRVKRHEKQEVIALSPTDDRPVFTRRDFFVQSPPSPPHPWVGPHTPTGEHIIHGDGQLKVVGTGEVGFEDSTSDGAAYDHASREARKQWKGLKHHSVLQLSLPVLNSIAMNPDMRVKHSFSLTGRGVFATKPIAKGETIMIVASTVRNVGVKGEITRLEEMCTFILQRALQLQDEEGVQEKEREEYLVFLHDWILSGQPSPLLEHWPKAVTERVIASIGGIENLYRLELHPIHIARMAAIIDLNSFLVESSYAERKGMSYFPEAGFLNHSCAPNATYEIMPAHMFEGSDYSVDEEARWEREEQLKIEAEVDEIVQKENFQKKSMKENSSTEANSPPLSGVVVVRPTTPENRLSASAQTRARARELMLVSGKGNELTENGAPEYLFCCRAEKDIAAGEEILISYVPQEWSFDNRQYVLHDRYRFYCKCPRCAPTIDSKYSRVPQLVVLLVFFSIALQLLIVRMRNNADRGRVDDYDGHSPEDEEHEKSSSKRMGLFEILKNEEAEEINSYAGMERLPSHIRDDYIKK